MLVNKILLFFVIGFVLCFVKGHEEKSSLAFVIDRTASMFNEISQVKENIDKVFDSVISSNTSHIDNFILVTFDDPKAELRAVTRDREQFKKALNEIELGGGGDCPEDSMSGIELALGNIHPNSFIYVFTDASAKDYKKKEVVKSLSQQKSTQVNFVLTGYCFAKNDLNTYDEIAEATSGYVFNIIKSDIGKVIDFIASTLKSKTTILSRKDFVDSFDQKLQFTIDSQISDVFISASSIKPDITVLDSTGKEVEVVQFLSTEKNKNKVFKNNTWHIRVQQKSIRPNYGSFVTAIALFMRMCKALTTSRFEQHAHLGTDTRDRGEFEKTLSEIMLVSGGDCPEASMEGIEKALEIVHPNSFVYVFTDASAKDYKKMEVIKSLSQKMSTQVNFLLTGFCPFAPSKQFVVYEQIAEATSGYVFNITKDDVSKVLGFVSNSLKSKSTIINRKVFVDTLDQQLQFTVDSKHSDVFICTSSSTPDITVLNSAGKEVEVVLFLSTEKNKIIKLKNEIKGVYFIKLNTKLKTVVTVSASTTVSFQHGFSTVLPTSLKETSIKPLGGITDKHYLSIELYNSARDVLLETVDLVDANGNIIRTEHLKLQNEGQQFYVTEPFDVPKKMFRIAINGLTKSKEKITRVTTTTVEYPNADAVNIGN